MDYRDNYFTFYDDSELAPIEMSKYVVTKFRLRLQWGLCITELAAIDTENCGCSGQKTNFENC